MQDKNLLIVGIDPGTTTAYAILDIEGKLIKTFSSKQLELNQIISESIKFGKVVLVGTDKSKVPNLVESFATKVGAKVVSPKEDLKVWEKRDMTKNFDFNDGHQSDALASALHAYRTYRPLLEKIDFFAEENKKQAIKDRIKEIVITKKISIRSAVGIIEEKHEEDRIVEKVVLEKRLSENDFLKVYQKLKEYESEIKSLKRYNANLNKRISELEKNSPREEIRASEKKTPDFREKRLRFLENLLRSKEKEKEFLKSLIKRFNEIISNMDDFYVLKKLDNLGIKEFNFKNKVINVKRNDIILVDEPNIYSSEAVDLLKEIVFVVVCRKPASKKVEDSLPFVFLNSKGLKIIEDKYFGFVEKKQFDAEKNKIDWVKKVINEYQTEKKMISRQVFNPYPDSLSGL